LPVPAYRTPTGGDASAQSSIQLDDIDDARVLDSGSVVRRLFIAAIIAMSLGAPVAEMFDRWDQTLRDGNDTEANVIVVALCIGVAFAVGTIVVAGCIRAMWSTRANRVRSARVAGRDLGSVLAPIPTISPPTVLRV
jgi:hypothetical protein